MKVILNIVIIDLLSSMISIIYGIIRRSGPVFERFIKGITEKKCPVPFLALGSQIQLLEG